MKFLWKVELKPDASTQNGLITNIYNILKIKNVDHLETREWFKTVYNACYLVRTSTGFDHFFGSVQGHPLRITDIMPRFSRYEQKRFLLIEISSDLLNQDNSLEYIEDIQKQLHCYLSNRFSNELIFDFSVVVKIEKYIESVKIQNPVALLTKEERKQIEDTCDWDKVVGEEYEKHYDIQYLGMKNNGKQQEYVRELKGIFVIEGEPIRDGQSTNERSPFFDKVHTDFMFFIRGNHLEKDFEDTFSKVKFLHSMVEFLEEQWIKIRTLFSIMPRFSILNKSIASKLFFYLLEVNAQIFALLTKIKFDVEHKKVYYDEAFERLHFTIQKSGNEAEETYFKMTNQITYSSYEAYNKKVEVLDNSVQRLGENINQLRSDFDSNTNIIMQGIMFLLSIILVVWGAVTLIYDKTVDFQNSISNPVSLLVGSLIFALVGMLFIYSGIAGYWINSSYRLIDKRIRETIDYWLNSKKDETTEKKDQEKFKILHQLYEVQKSKNETYQKSTITCLEFCTFIIPGVALNRIAVDEAAEIIGEMGKHLNKKEK